jgi:hypothetical protein
MDRLTEQKIAHDLDLCDLIAAIGTPAAKRQMTKHRKVIMAALHAENVADGFDALTDDELLAALA